MIHLYFFISAIIFCLAIFLFSASIAASLCLTVLPLESFTLLPFLSGMFLGLDVGDAVDYALEHPLV
jgi:hypothetical protein